MFKTISRKILPNPFDALLKKCAKNGQKSFLIEWNRGLGDIALGLYAMVYRIHQFIDDPVIYFITRQSLQEGFSFLEHVDTLLAPDWERGKSYDVYQALERMKIDPSNYDVIIQKPDPTYWVRWQRGYLTPKLKWDSSYEGAYTKFSLDPTKKYIGVQTAIDTKYNLWRGYSLEKYHHLFHLIETTSDTKVLLLGEKQEQTFDHKNIIDLRGKTSLFELLSIIKNCCSHIILPDSGILSFVYYLDVHYPIKVISLWGDVNQGVLKQNVSSPNIKLTHIPLIGAYRNVESINVQTIYQHLDLSEDRQRN